MPHLKTVVISFITTMAVMAVVYRVDALRKVVTNSKV